MLSRSASPRARVILAAESRRASSSGTITPHADPSRVPVRDLRPAEREKLEFHRRQLSGRLAHFIDQTEKYEMMREDRKISNKVVADQLSRAHAAEKLYLDMRSYTNDDFYVRLYDKAHPNETMEDLAESDAAAIMDLIAEAPFGSPWQNQAKAHMDSVLPKWRPTIQKLDWWTDLSREQTRRASELEIQRNHRQLLLRERRFEQADLAAKGESQMLKRLQEAEARVTRAREQFEREAAERQLREDQERVERTKRDQQEREERERRYQEALQEVHRR